MNLRLTAAACLVTFSLLAGAAQAGTADNVLAGVRKCAAVKDDAARLSCYDALAPQAALPPPPTKQQLEATFGANPAQVVGAAPEQQTTPEQFGSDKLPATQEKEEAAQAELESITAGVTEYAYTPFGKFIVFLDNGQIWRQVPGDADQAMFHKPAKDNKVTIERGMIGSYNMTINDSSRVFKVTRVK